MLLTLSTTTSPAGPDATDLGFLLHKHPGKAQVFDLPVGRAHVLWPEATAERATVALLLEVDPVGLVRDGRRGTGGAPLAHYVDDRPYAATSLLSTALGRVFRTALTGRCDARPELAERALPLEVRVPALPCRGGVDLVERLFAPLGWTVAAEPVPLDPAVPAWGDSPYVDLRLSGTLRVADALAQLYVLVPVLDDAKHYWVSTDEVDKLVRAGGAWLAGHPERELITRRFLKHQGELVRSAAQRLAEVDDLPEQEAPDPPRPLAALRRQAVLQVLRDEGAASVVDLGCGEGALLRDLLADPAFRRVTGVDVSDRALRTAERRLQLDRMPDSVRARLDLLVGSVTYRDDRLAGADALVLMEVVEHVDPPRLPALERTVFGCARPGAVVVTTPNAEHNVRYGLAQGQVRHPDHRFEWTRAQFRAWTQGVAAAHGYDVRHLPVGDDDPEVGPPTQLAVFRRSA